MSLKLKLAYKGQEHTATVPLGAFFGDLKKEASKQLNIEPQYLKLLFRGREKRDTDSIVTSGIKSGSVINAVETAEYMRKRAAELAAAQQPGGGSGVPAAAIPAASVSWPAPEPQPAPSWPAQVKQKLEEILHRASGRFSATNLKGHLQGSSAQMPARAAPAPAPVVDRAPIGPQPKPAPQLSPEEEVKADEEQMLALIASIHADVDTLIPRMEDVPKEVDWAEKAKAKALLAELLTRHLLTLDGIKAKGYRETAPHVRAARKSEIVRINVLHDKLEKM